MTDTDSFPVAREYAWASTAQQQAGGRIGCDHGLYSGSREVAIRCRDLRKTYDSNVTALCGLDLEVYTGECFGLLGPNGAGKTTTIEILEGLLAPSSGDIRIFGVTRDVTQHKLQEWLGISLQETQFAEKLTTRETVQLFASFYQQPRAIDELLAQLSLADKADTWVGKLSGGQRQRLALATALVGNPRILFLDEPTTGLDPQARRQLWVIVRRFQRRGGTIMLTTHSMDEAERWCNRIAIIDQGRVIASGSPAELISCLGAHEVVEFAMSHESEDSVRRLCTTLPGIEALHVENEMVTIRVREARATIAALLSALPNAGQELDYLTTRKPSLEDVFVRLTGHHLREN